MSREKGGSSCTYPARPQDVDVTAADTTVGDANVDIGLLPLLGLILLPDHVALSGLLVLAHPSLKFVVCCHGCGLLGGALVFVNGLRSPNVGCSR